MFQHSTLDFSKWVGIPYEKFDCWHLLVKFYEEELKIVLPPYYEIRPENPKIVGGMVEEAKASYKEVYSVENFDLLLVEMFGVHCHIGMYYKGKIFHTHKSTGSVFESYAKWQKRVVGIYRVSQ